MNPEISRNSHKIVCPLPAVSGNFLSPTTRARDAWQGSAPEAPKEVDRMSSNKIRR